MSQLNSLLESAGSGWKNMQSDAARLANKWEKTGLLEGFNKEVDKNNMSLILENQAKQLVTEQSQTGGTANFSVGTGEQWAGVALPLVRKVFGQIAAKEFVSVQPMNLPSGLVFYLDFQYGSTKTPFSAGDSLYGNANADHPFGTATSNLDQLGAGGLYGAGKFTYSTNQFSESVDLVLQGGVASASAVFSDINFDSRLSASLSENEIWKFQVATSDLTSFDADAVRGFVLISGSIGDAVSVQADDLLMSFTKVNGVNLEFFVSASDASLLNLTDFDVYYQKATTMSPYEVGDFEAGNDFAEPNSLNQTQIAIPEINIQMRSEAIVAKTKKLKAVWTPEFAQDLNAYQALDAEAEVTNIMSEYISLEIDLEILSMLIDSAAAGTETWSAVNNQSITGGGNGTISDLGFYNSQGQWFQTLGTKIQKLSNIIHQKTLRGGANFLVCSPAVGTIMESIPGFAADTDGDASKATYAFGVQKVGSLNGRYKVYKNPYMTENQILLGFRGQQFLETGAVFAPYIPLIMTPLIYDPETFTPRKGLLTRYAKKMVRPEFYGTIQVNGLNSL